MKTVRINYIDFWSDLDKENCLFTRILKKYYNVEISDKPDYVFCSYFGDSHFKYRDAVKIFFVGENVVPDFNLYDYALGFHYIDFEDRYLRLPLYVLYDYRHEAVANKHLLGNDYYLGKSGFCNYVISNPDAAGERDAMVDMLNKYKRVDSGGRYRNNVGGPVRDKMEFASKYKFTMSFENSSTPGYTTEKIYEAFAAGTIPIYWGNPDIAREFNPKAFVNCHEYGSLEEACRRIREIDENEELYLEIMKEPAYTSDSLAYKYLQEDYTDDFLRNIFECDYGSAKRRNMVYVGRDYQHKMDCAVRVTRGLDVIKKPIHLLNKTIKQKTSR